jgi:prolipoprotein diacylglyceryltransferase
LNPDNIIQIGPLALALDRLVAVGLMLAFLTALDWIVRRYRVATWQPAGVALLAGLVAARAGHVWQYRESYALEPVAALQAWLGGWDWRAGVAATGLVLLLTMRRRKPVLAGLGVLGGLTLAWAGFLAAGENKSLLRCQRRSKNRPLWRSKSRPLMLRQVQSKGPRSGPFAFGRFDGSVFVDGGLVLLRPAGSGATATG